MRIENEVKLDFCDVLIKPKRSDSPSRYNVDLTRKFKFLNSEAEWEGIPIIASNLVATGTFAMAKQLGRMGLSTALHKFYSLDELKTHWDERLPSVPDYRNFFTIGIKDKDLEKLDAFATTNHVPAICIDVANGYTKYFVDRCLKVRQKYPKSIIMAGNVCTPEMAHELVVSGKVDIVKVGIGPGCFIAGTKVVTKNGHKKIEKVDIGDEVLTHTGTYKKVTATMCREHTGNLIDINGTKCTPNHEFYVVHKEHEQLVTEDNLSVYAKWVSAEELSEDYFLVEMT